MNDNFEKLAEKLLALVRAKLVTSGIELTPDQVVRITFSVMDSLRFVAPELGQFDETTGAHYFAKLLPAVEKKLKT